MTDEMKPRPTVTPEILERFRAYHRAHPSWGPLHTVLDDNNLADDFVNGAIGLANVDGDSEGAWLAVILLRFSKTQRARIARET